MSYRHQLELVMGSGYKKVLIIGLGDNIIPSILKSEGFEVYTCDIDPSLKPDFLQSITKLDLQGNTFEVVLCCQILEHIPFDEMDNVLDRIKAITTKKLIVSLPEKALRISLMFKLPRIRNFYFNVVVPLFFRKHKFDGQHYWELGTSENYKRKFLDASIKKFKLTNYYRYQPNPYHHFFIFDKV